MTGFVTPAAWQISRMELPEYPFSEKSFVAPFRMASRALPMAEGNYTDR